MTSTSIYINEIATNETLLEAMLCDEDILELECKFALTNIYKSPVCQQSFVHPFGKTSKS